MVIFKPLENDDIGTALNRWIGEPLSPVAIAEALRRVATYVGYDAKDAAAVSGHSIRVGATQDLLALNIDLGSVMQAGRWKSNRMPKRYGEQVLAARGGIARAAEKQGRDAIVEPKATGQPPSGPERHRV